MLPRNTSLRPSPAPLRLALTCAAVVAMLGCASAPPSGGESVVRVLVYNIHAGKDASGEENLERVATLIGETGADLVLLQEVDRGTRRSGGVDQLAELERRTGFHGAFGRTLDYQGGEYGIAVLSRWPIRSDTLIALPVEPRQERAGGSYEPRGALRVTMDVPGPDVGVLNTHLDASGDDHYRRQEVEAVRRIAADLRASHDWTVVGGDFNAEPGTSTIRTMVVDGWRDAWSECGAGDGRTFPAHAPVKRIDYLFLTAGLGCAVARVAETTTSDHRPLLVRLTLTRSRAE
ncbi:MAG TPA: endonuclease/exonuclease/phosphatase family protein [Longimicrobiales bacterium]|nr:endonuclease/exonuclease/phosphatase family protein [Longimicrobiales bacterium]